MSDILPQDNTPRKQCTGPCGQWLPATAEYFHRKGTNRLTSYCKECRNAKFRKAPDAPDGFRRCSQCNEILPATPEFFARHHMVKKDGLRSRCKSCVSKNNEEYNDRPEVQEYRSIYGQTYQSRPEVIKHRHDYHQVYYARPEKNAQRRINKHKRRACEKDAPGSYTAQDIHEQYERQKGKCYYCRNKVKWGNHHVDHVIPLSRGGSNDISNLVITCAHCNISKNDRLPHEWPKGGRLL